MNGGTGSLEDIVSDDRFGDRGLVTLLDQRDGHVIGLGIGRLGDRDDDILLLTRIERDRRLGGIVNIDVRAVYGTAESVEERDDGELVF